MKRRKWVMGGVVGGVIALGIVSLSLLWQERRTTGESYQRRDSSLGAQTVTLTQEVPDSTPESLGESLDQREDNPTSLLPPCCQ